LEESDDKEEDVADNEGDEGTADSSPPGPPIVKHLSPFYGPDVTLHSAHKDLSKKSTISMIAKYVWTVHRKVLRQWYIEHIDDEDNTSLNVLPAVTLGGYFLCDGQPTAQFSKLANTDNRMFYLNDKDAILRYLFPEYPEDNKNEELEKWLEEIDSKVGFLGKGKGTGSHFHSKFLAFPVGFHACLKLHNCCGLMFSSITEHFYCAWRDTLNKVHWILFPKDP